MVAALALMTLVAAFLVVGSLLTRASHDAALDHAPFRQARRSGTVQFVGSSAAELVSRGRAALEQGDSGTARFLFARALVADPLCATLLGTDLPSAHLPGNGVALLAAMPARHA